MARLRATVCTFMVVLGAMAASATAQDAPPPTAVTVRTLEPQTVTLTSTLPGRVHPSAEAEVRPQVNGIITEQLFDDGSQVTEGDVLYRIDPGTYQATVAQARASVQQAEAQLRSANREAARIQTLQERGTVSNASQDDAISTRDSAVAALELARAQLQSAQLELDRTEIRARLSGEIGLSEVSRGVLVTANQATPLAVIRAIDPVYVDVTQSAAELLAWRRRTIAGNDSNAEAVRLTLADGSTYAEPGTLKAAEPHVNEQTGVVVLRLSFANPDELLLPGMYVQVEMPTGTLDNVFLAPQEAVTRDRRGNPSALVVNGENVIEQRGLTVVQDRGADWIVSEGLESGDRIVVAGLQKIAPGAVVAPEELDEMEVRQEASAEAGNDAGPEIATGETDGE